MFKLVLRTSYLLIGFLCSCGSPKNNELPSADQIQSPAKNAGQTKSTIAISVIEKNNDLNNKAIYGINPLMKALLNGQKAYQYEQLDWTENINCTDQHIDFLKLRLLKELKIENWQLLVDQGQDVKSIVSDNVDLFYILIHSWNKKGLTNQDSSAAKNLFKELLIYAGHEHIEVLPCVNLENTLTVNKMNWLIDAECRSVIQDLSPCQINHVFARKEFENQSCIWNTNSQNVIIIPNSGLINVKRYLLNGLVEVYPVMNKNDKHSFRYGKESYRIYTRLDWEGGEHFNSRLFLFKDQGDKIELLATGVSRSTNYSWLTIDSVFQYKNHIMCILRSSEGDGGYWGGTNMIGEIDMQNKSLSTYYHMDFEAHESILNEYDGLVEGIEDSLWGYSTRGNIFDFRENEVTVLAEKMLRPIPSNSPIQYRLDTAAILNLDSLLKMKPILLHELNVFQS